MYASISTTGRYYSIKVHTERYGGNYHDIYSDADLTEQMRDLCAWLYLRLQDEYYYLTSEETITNYLTDEVGRYTEDGSLW